MRKYFDVQEDDYGTSSGMVNNAWRTSHVRRLDLPVRYVA